MQIGAREEVFKFVKSKRLQIYKFEGTTLYHYKLLSVFVFQLFPYFWLLQIKLFLSMKRLLPIIFSLSAFLILFKSANAQLTVDGSLTPQQLVQSILIGNGVSASNVTYTGVSAGIGSFNSSVSNIGLPAGIILSTGNITDAIGPNNTDGGFYTDFSGNGDVDLDAISGVTTYDAAILEFDFVPASDTLRFNYVFGSEEYLEYVNGTVNDAFGFFISGPGIVGPYSNNSQNIALIPGTTTPVSINTVNDGLNAAYYFNNQTPPPPVTAVQYDGFTVPLVAEAIVQCGEIYHIKLAIADGGDGVWDSGVFLEAGSFGTSGVEITASATASGDSTIVEGCGSAVFTFSRPDTSAPFVIHFNIEGTATPGLDYNQIPDSIVIPQGQITEQLFVDAFFDGIADSLETITLTINFLSGCGGDTLYATIYIRSIDSIKVEVGEDYNICTPDETATLKATANGGYGPLTYTWSNGAGLGDSVIVTPLETTSYFVTVTDTCGNTVISDSIEVVVQCDVIVPNIFTPNGDTFNETFFVENLDQYPGSGVKIYNRWGRKVFEDDDYQNDWDGEKLADGIYFYIVTVSDPGQGTKTGHVTIMRD